ncbi:hypothetical protein PLEOSDRAFT_171849 [Pleurotus ostreatus PC15]|uniref:Uncharacterized protein n=1 Tax=Pleurotus ostreatus (strain PC15) TaxID=1137138 RepID=A0A067NEE2_PLEO1|nr:hypothetical protein PLEOSDRAFT_171849 [Pleurotus ostreatus PC15]
MVYRGKNSFSGFAFEHPALPLHGSHSLLRYAGHGNYLLTDPDSRSTKSFTITELARFVDTNQKLQRGQVLLEELPRGYILFANVYNKEPLVDTKFSTIDKHRNLVIGRGPSLRFLGITTEPPRRGRGYDGYEQIELPREDGLDGLERKILGVVGSVLQGREGLQPFRGVGVGRDPVPPSGNYRGSIHLRGCSQGTGYNGIGGGTYRGRGGGLYHGRGGRGATYRGGSYRGAGQARTIVDYRAGQTRTIVDYRDGGIHAFAARMPAHHPDPPNVDGDIHEDFVMDGTPAPDYSVVAGTSSYDPMVNHNINECAELPMEDTEVVEDEGELTESATAARDGNDTEDEEDN